jgi:hypothetical protein
VIDLVATDLRTIQLLLLFATKCGHVTTPRPTGY